MSYVEPQAAVPINNDISIAVSMVRSPASLAAPLPSGFTPCCDIPSRSGYRSRRDRPLEAHKGSGGGP